MGSDPASVVNQPPTMPANPNPQNDSKDVSVNPVLSWSCSDPDNDTLSYDIYFGTDDDDLPLVREALTDRSYSPGVLEYNKEYVWKVIAKDDHQNSTEGETWIFTTAEDTSGSDTVSWSGDILPIFRQNSCVGCHGGNGGLSLGTYASLMRGGVSGQAVIPSDADNSLLYRKVDGFSAGDRMPQGGARLDQDLIDMIRDWINEGALDN